MSDFNQAIRELQQEVEDLPISLQEAFNIAADIALNEMKSHPSISGTSLANNIRIFLDEQNYMGVSMPDYGYFLNFGVRGLNNKTTQIPVDPITMEFVKPSTSEGFAFGTNGSKKQGKHYWGIHYPGIEAREFFDVEQLVARVAELINENLQL